MHSSSRLRYFFLLLLLLSSFSLVLGFEAPLGVCPSCFTSPTTNQSLDHGRIVQKAPSVVFNPRTPQDISHLLTSIYSSPAYNNITVGPNGARHSMYGQAQVPGGIVVDMRSFPRSIKVDAANRYVDVDGGTLWVELLEETLKSGLAPRSWTDYLYLSVGGTLSVAGISGQTFRHGPQIVNVLEMDVVTGKGEIVTCSANKEGELFHGILGGLGQFGIITRARIALDVAPTMARRVTVPYTDFNLFTNDEELLIAMNEPGYIEGQVVSESTGSSNISYVIEFALYYNEGDPIQQRLDAVLSRLSSRPAGSGGVSDLSYFDFLNRVKKEEDGLRKLGLWEVPHPWLNLFVPRSNIAKFNDLLVETITAQPMNGAPLLFYPFLTNKWNPKMSAVLPHDGTGKNTVYAVSILRSAATSCTPESDCMKALLGINQRITDAAVGGMGAKVYLAGWKDGREWAAHFGGKWETFKRLKARYDPLHLLAPGVRIFRRIGKEACL